jgi:hypothetical protein
MRSFHARGKAAERSGKRRAGPARAVLLFYLFKEGFSKTKNGK